MPVLYRQIVGTEADKMCNSAVNELRNGLKSVPRLVVMQQGVKLKKKKKIGVTW